MYGRIFCIFSFVLAVSFAQTDVFQFCYKTTQIDINATKVDNIITRQEEIETALRNILDEMASDENSTVSFKVDSVKLVRILNLEEIGTQYEVRVCLTDSNVDEIEFTYLLQTFNISTQIDGPKPLAGEKPVSFYCESNSVYLNASNPYFENLGIDYRDLHLGNCKGVLEGDAILFEGKCEPVIEIYPSYVLLKWSLTNVNNSEAAINIGNYVTIPITCEFEWQANVSLNFSSERSNVGVPQQEKYKGGYFNFRVETFANAEMTQQLPSIMDTDTKIYFALSTKETLPSDVKIRCESFSTSAAFGSTLTLDLIRNGCPVAETRTNSRVLDTLMIIQNGVGSKAIVAVDSHFFGRSKITVATFLVNICMDSSGNDCEYNCSTNDRRKRSIASQRHRRDLDQSEQLQIALERNPGDWCNKYCGEGGICILDQDGNQECACADGFVEQEDGICRADKQDQLYGSQEAFMITLIALVSLLIAICAVMLAVYLMRIKKS